MEEIYSLEKIGFDKNLQIEYDKFKEQYLPGRVSAEYRGIYKVYTHNEEKLCTLSGKMMLKSKDKSDYPKIGDWVLIDRKNDGDRGVINGILKRKSSFSRKSAGSTSEEQIIAVNIDIAFICMSLNQNFNLRRLERYLTVAWNSGAVPVVVITKADLAESDDYKNERLKEAKNVSMYADVVCVSTLKNEGIDCIRDYLKDGKTGVFIGSSGVGKSSIINALKGQEIQKVNGISKGSDKGQHTTTNREMIVLESGGVVIDTPGMREIHLTYMEDGAFESFEDIENLALKCKFSDCRHKNEPGCAVRKAIEAGELDAKRLNNYIRLKKEARFMKRKEKMRERIQLKKSSKKYSKKDKYRSYDE